MMSFGTYLTGRLLLREDGDGNIALQTSLDVIQCIVNGIKSLLSDGEQLSSIPGASILHIACVANVHRNSSRG